MDLQIRHPLKKRTHTIDNKNNPQILFANKQTIVWLSNEPFRFLITHSIEAEIQSAYFFWFGIVNERHSLCYG